MRDVIALLLLYFKTRGIDQTTSVEIISDWMDRQQESLVGKGVGDLPKELVELEARRVFAGNETFSCELAEQCSFIRGRLCDAQACLYPEWAAKHQGGRPEHGQDEQGEDDPIEVRRESDYGHAQVLSQKLAGKLRYAPHRGTWMLYNGRRWVPRIEPVIAKLAADILFQQYISELERTRDHEQVKALTRAIRDCTIAARIAGALYFLQGWPGILTAAEEWDAKPWLLNVNNGTIDLKTGELRAHNPDDLITMLAPADYDPSASCDRWLSHIAIFLPDADVRRQVQRDLGLALVGAAMEESLPIWYGGGANGRSTTSRTLMKLLGSYARRAAPNLLIQSKYERHPAEIADLAGSRIVFSVEVDEGKRLAEVLVKEMTGGDVKKARFMRQDFFEFEQTFSIFLIVNHRPIVTGTDEAIWRRIRLVPWTYTIPKAERRPQEEVVEELLVESSGILNWLLAGLQDWQGDHYWTAPAVQVATEAYRNEQDILGPFLDEYCDLKHHYSVPVGELYAAYEGWCRASSELPITKVNFQNKLRNRGISSGKGTGGVRTYFGIRLKLYHEKEDRHAEADLVAPSGATSISPLCKNDFGVDMETTPLLATNQQREPQKAPANSSIDQQQKEPDTVVDELGEGCNPPVGGGGPSPPRMCSSWRKAHPGPGLPTTRSPKPVQLLPEVPGEAALWSAVAGVLHKYPRVHRGRRGVLVADVVDRCDFLTGEVEAALQGASWEKEVLEASGLAIWWAPTETKSPGAIGVEVPA